MSEPDGSAAPAHPADLDRLTGMFVGSLLLLGGVALLVIAVAIRQLPTAGYGGGIVYVLPGGHGRHGLEPLGTLVLAAAGALLVLLGCAGVILGRLSAYRISAQPSAAPAAHRESRRRPRAIAILAIGAAALAAVLMFRWFSPHP